MPQVKKRYDKLFGNYEEEEYSPIDIPKDELLNTIKLPNNLAQLTKRLPKSNYSVARHKHTISGNQKKRNEIEDSVKVLNNHSRISRHNDGQTLISNSGQK